MLLTFEDSSGYDVSDQTYHQFGDRFYVYKIGRPVSADITETESLELKLVQTENLDNPILGKFLGGHADGFESLCYLITHHQKKLQFMFGILQLKILKLIHRQTELLVQ